MSNDIIYRATATVLDAHTGTAATEAEDAFGAIMSGEATPAQIAGLLMAMRVRGAEAAEGIHAPRSLVDRLAQICETQDPIAARGDQGSTLVEKLRSLRGGRGRG